MLPAMTLRKEEIETPLSEAEVEVLTNAFARRIGQRIRELREMLGMSFSDIGRYGINRSTASRIENGLLNLTAKTTVRFAAVLGVRPWELYVPTESSELRPKKGRSAWASDEQIEKAAHAFRKQIGKRVRSLRRLQGLSIMNLAALGGLSQDVIEQVEDGVTNLRASTAIRLADAIGVQPHELFLPTEQSGIRPSSKRTEDDDA